MGKDMDLEQRSLSDDLTREKDISKQLQNHLNPSSSTEAQLLSREEILRSHVKELPTRNSGVLSETVTHSAASDDRDAPRKRKTPREWTATTFVDGYSWKKKGQNAIAGYKYPREYFRCSHRYSKGCLAIKQVQRLDEDPTLFKVTHRGRHTCEQSSHLATAAAVEPTKAASGDKDVSGKTETTLMWTVARLDGYSWRKYAQKNILGSKYPREYYRCTHRLSQGCPASRLVQRSNDDPSIFEVTYRGRHTCEQSSHLATATAVEPTEAASEDKEVSGKIETALMWTVARLDGYSWRKYAQKDILGSKYPREYFRCTHRLSQGCRATRLVQRSNDDPSIFEVSCRGRHTCEQFSSQLPQPIKAESKKKPEKSEMVSFERILVVANFVLELPSAVFDQLSYVPKPLYALILMLLSFAALLLCIVELGYQRRKKRVTWTRRHNNRNSSFSKVESANKSRNRYVHVGPKLGTSLNAMLTWALDWALAE
ncbi:hypothetical protein SLE2022_029540 [Rubroshorea leprosula]